MLILHLLQNTAVRYFFLQVITLLLFPFSSIHKPELLPPQFPLSPLPADFHKSLPYFFIPCQLFGTTLASQQCLQTTMKLLAERQIRRTT